MIWPIKAVHLTQVLVLVEGALKGTSWQTVSNLVKPQRLESIAKRGVDVVLIAVFVMHRLVSVQVAVLQVTMEFSAIRVVVTFVHLTVVGLVKAHLRTACNPGEPALQDVFLVGLGNNADGNVQ